jgi:hypothetical protein
MGGVEAEFDFGLNQPESVCDISKLNKVGQIGHD